MLMILNDDNMLYKLISFDFLVMFMKAFAKSLNNANLLVVVDSKPKA